MAPQKQRAAPKASPSKSIQAWEDDPISGGKPIARPVPSFQAGQLKLAFNKTAPPPKAYPPAAKEFRYWTTAEALQRAIAFWQPAFPAGTTWQPGATLKVHLDEGVDLNAYYTRDYPGQESGLYFFHAKVKGKTVFSSESPDVTCHELGHAVLDALRPDFWDLSNLEAAALHESFGDMSALLCGLQLPSLRAAVLKETGGSLYSTSRLSRLAEQLGWAIRQGHPDQVETDCLRNAVNSHFYVDPNQLLPNAPASSLSSEPHSFSRVFTSAFFEALGGMVSTLSQNPAEDVLGQASLDMRTLLVDGVRNAQVVPELYAQVAAKIVEADAHRFAGKYSAALKSAFVRHGVLPLSVAATPRGGTRAGAAAAMAAPAAAPAGLARFDGEHFGLGGLKVVAFSSAGNAASTTRSIAASGAALAPRTAEQTAYHFLRYLFVRGRVQLGDHGDRESRVAHPRVRKTHELTRHAEGVIVVRRSFDCGLHPER
ncbi:MAG: hypothetical protein HY303_14320 [Candidatus Wallbacteria bacterium]|nr:hypothetical protein [Candidatus Wallbacteria bacterium]